MPEIIKMSLSGAQYDLLYYLKLELAGGTHWADILPQHRKAAGELVAKGIVMTGSGLHASKDEHPKWVKLTDAGAVIAGLLVKESVSQKYADAIKRGY